MDKISKYDYLGPQGRAMLAHGVFFGGWEDADSTRTLLEPLERFDHHALHAVHAGPSVPEEAIERHIAKAMAGAPKSTHIRGAILRRALQNGRLRSAERHCVDEVVASFKAWELHLPATAWGLSIYELARAVTLSWHRRHFWSPWLNLWADDPERPSPTPPYRPPWTDIEKRDTVSRDTVS